MHKLSIKEHILSDYCRRIPLTNLMVGWGPLTQILPEFIPRDAMLARLMLSSCVRRPFVHLSVRHTPALYRNGYVWSRK